MKSLLLLSAEVSFGICKCEIWDTSVLASENIWIKLGRNMGLVIKNFQLVQKRQIQRDTAFTAKFG